MQQEDSDNSPPVGLDPPWHPPTETTEGFTLAEKPRGPRGLAAVAWVLIILIVAVRLVLLAVVKEDTEGADLVGQMLMRIEGRYLVGAAEVGGDGPLLYGQAKGFYDGTVSQRLRFVVLAGELAGPKEARAVLDDLAGLIHEEQQETANGENPFQPRPENVRAMDLLKKLYPQQVGEHGASAPPGEAGAENVNPATIVNTAALTKDERKELIETLGWFGKLALAPAGTPDTRARQAVLAPARRTFIAVIAGFIAAAAVGFGGLAGLITMVVLALLRQLRSGIAPGAAHHGIYAETFALWLLAFFVLQIGAEAVGLIVPKAPEVGLSAALIAFLLSLLVLGWPVARGIPWRQVRADIGWKLGRTRSGAAWLIEAVVGLGCYAMTLPLLAVGLLLTFLLLLLDQVLAGPQPTFAPAGGPAHPILAELSDGNVVLITLVLVLGSIAAPIVEETMFRGVLYRHLRDASATLGFFASVVFSTALTAFIFAVIHPQGWVAIPALMALATGFTLAREWRGTLIPAFVMHGTSNAIVLGMVVLLATG